MRKLRLAACTVFVALPLFLGPVPRCGAEPKDQDSGTFLSFMWAIGSRVCLEHRWPAGPGFEVGVGSIIFEDFEGGFNAVAEALAILPLFRFGRSGALDLALGMPALYWMPGAQVFVVSLGGAARLRFGLGSRWTLFLRGGAGYPLVLSAQGMGGLIVLPDVGIGAAFRL